MTRVHKLEYGDIFTITIKDFEIILKTENNIFRKMIEEEVEEIIEGQVITSIHYRGTNEIFTIQEVNDLIERMSK